MITDEMIEAAAAAGRAEASAWRIRPSPIVGSSTVFLHDAERERPLPIDPDATFTEYRCNSVEEANSFITGFAWRAGIEAALACQAKQETKQ